MTNFGVISQVLFQSCVLGCMYYNINSLDRYFIVDGLDKVG